MFCEQEMGLVLYDMHARELQAQHDSLLLLIKLHVHVTFLSQEFSGMFFSIYLFKKSVSLKTEHINDLLTYSAISSTRLVYIRTSYKLPGLYRILW